MQGFDYLAMCFAYRSKYVKPLAVTPPLLHLFPSRSRSATSPFFFFITDVCNYDDSYTHAGSKVLHSLQQAQSDTDATARATEATLSQLGFDIEAIKQRLPPPRATYRKSIYRNSRGRCWGLISLVTKRNQMSPDNSIFSNINTSHHFPLLRLHSTFQCMLTCAHLL